DRALICRAGTGSVACRHHRYAVLGCTPWARAQSESFIIPACNYEHLFATIYYHKPQQLTALMCAEALASFPPGVVNLVTGADEAGEALVTHPDTDLVAFTGSVETGKRIGALCAEQVKRTHLELGGKDAFI